MGNFELDTDFDKLEEERILEEILNKRLAQLSGNKKYKNLLDVFRNRFDFFEKLILLYKANKNITKDTGDTAYKDIKESLVLMGYIPNVNSISNAIVGNYLSTVRDERELARVNNRKHKSKNKIEEQSKIENSNLSSPSVEVVEEVKPFVERSAFPECVPGVEWFNPTVDSMSSYDVAIDWTKAKNLVSATHYTNEWSEKEEDLFKHLIYLKIVRKLNSERDSWLDIGTYVADIYMKLYGKRKRLSLPIPDNK